MRAAGIQGGEDDWGVGKRGQGGKEGACARRTFPAARAVTSSDNPGTVRETLTKQTAC